MLTRSWPFSSVQQYDRLSGPLRRPRASPPRGCGAIPPGCGSCSTSAAAQPIRGPGSHASYGRPSARRPSRAVRAGRVGSRRATGASRCRVAVPHPDVRDAARHGRASPWSRRGRRGARALGAAPAPAGPARRRARAARASSRARAAPRCSAPTGGRSRRAGAAAIAGAPAGQRQGDRPRAPLRRAPGRPPGCRAALRRPRRAPRQASVAAARCAPRSGPALQRAAAAALGGKLGGIAVVRPRDGYVLALAGLAVSAPQPPGSTFKIITLSECARRRASRRRRAPIRCAPSRPSRASSCATRATSRAAAR